MIDGLLRGGADRFAKDAERLDLCHDMPSTFTEARGRCTLGHGPCSATVARAADGVKAAVSFQRGTFDAKGKVAYWAITGNGILWAAGRLPTSTEVYPDHAYDPGAFTITLPGDTP